MANIVPKIEVLSTGAARKAEAGDVLVAQDGSALSVAGAPAAHAASHVDGSDDIQTADTLQKGLMSGAHAAKLNGIETFATADQTGAEIKTAYEAEPSAFTDAQFTKLAGVEALADVTDAANVATAGAIMDSDVSPGEGFLRKVGAGTYTAHGSNLSSGVAPGTGDDTTAGYSVGSLWIDTTADKSYVCVDSTTAAAVWKETSGGASSPLTTKGDIFGYAAADARIPVGAMGEVLAPLSSDVNGVAWGWPGGGQFPGAAHQIGRWCADGGSGLSLAGSGLLKTITEVESSSGLNSPGPMGLRLTQNTAASVNSEAYAMSGLIAEGNANPYMVMQYDIQQISNTRVFAGLAENATPLSTDTPTIALVGFAYSTDRGDTNIQLIRAAASGAGLARTDTGVAMSTATRIFRLWSFDAGATYSWEILPENGASVLASGTVTTGLPAASTNLKLLMGTRTLSAAQQRIRHGGAMISLGRRPQ